MSTLRRGMGATLLAVAGLWVGYLVLGPSGYLAVREREKEVRLLQDDIHRLALENLRLASQVEALENNPREVERIARQEMKLARPGEVIFVLPEPQKK